MPLPLDSAVVRDGPRPSGWAAIRRLASQNTDPCQWLSMADVLRAMVAEAARGPANARGAHPSLDIVPVAAPEEVAEFEQLAKGWKLESLAFRESAEYLDAKVAQLSAQDINKAQAQTEAADKMAVDAEMALRAESEAPQLSVEEQKINLASLLGSGQGSISSLNVAALKAKLEEEYKEVCSGKHPTMADVKKSALVAKLKEHVEASLRRLGEGSSAAVVVDEDIDGYSSGELSEDERAALQALHEVRARPT